jgi:hypothetical protein
MCGWCPFQSSTYQKDQRVASPIHPIVISAYAQKASQEQMRFALEVTTLVPSQHYSLKRCNRERATRPDNLPCLHHHPWRRSLEKEVGRL